MDKEQFIQDYITNRLSESNKEQVHKLLETDEDFKNIFETHNDVTFAYKLSEANSLKARFQELEQRTSKNNSYKSSSYKSLYLAIASIVITGFFYFYNRDISGEELFNSNFEIYPNTYQPVTRSTSQKSSTEAFVAYENSDFELAQLEFEGLLKTNNNVNLKFYYALSLLNQSKFDLALVQLKQLNKSNHDYRAESIWYSALIYLKQEDFENAKSQLEELNNLNSTFKVIERKRILKALHNR